jgi:hypothetical protein
LLFGPGVLIRLLTQIHVSDRRRQIWGIVKGWQSRSGRKVEKLGQNAQHPRLVPHYKWIPRQESGVIGAAEFPVGAILGKRQSSLARTMVCTKECIGAAWLARRRLSPASSRSPKMLKRPGRTVCRSRSKWPRGWNNLHYEPGPLPHPHRPRRIILDRPLAHSFCESASTRPERAHCPIRSRGVKQETMPPAEQCAARRTLFGAA